MPSPAVPSGRATRRAMPLAGLSMASTAVNKPGTGKNRMTETGFAQPLVERVELPGTTQGFEFKVRDDLDEKKLNMQEKVKKEKPGKRQIAMFISFFTSSHVIGVNPDFVLACVLSPRLPFIGKRGCRRYILWGSTLI